VTWNMARAWHKALSRQIPHEEQRCTLPANLAGELTSSDGQTANSLSSQVHEHVLPAMRLQAVCAQEKGRPAFAL